MKNFIRQILNKINKLDSYTSSYIKNSHNIEIPALAYNNWAIHLAEINDYNSAIEKLETAILMSNQNPKPCLTLGVLYARIKNYEKAEEILKIAISRDTQNTYAYSVFGSVLIAENKFQEAEEILKKGLKLSPYNAELYLNYGILLTKQQKSFKAIEMYKKAKMINPQNLHSYFLLGVTYFEANKISEAFCEFKQIENINPKYTKLNYYLALCYNKEQNYMAVLEYTQKALEEEPNNPIILVLLAQTYINLNNLEKALQTYEIANNNNININDIKFYIAWATALIKGKKIEEAKNIINKALEINENDSEALHRMGRCLYEEKNYDEAKKYYEKSINSNKMNSLAYSDFGMLLYELNSYDEAISKLQQAINISAKSAYLYFYIANSHYKQGRIKKSAEFYEKTIDYYPRHTEAYINWTVSLLDLNDTKDALRKIRSAYQINKNSEKVLMVYALTCLKSGLYNEAIEKADTILKNNTECTFAKLIKSHCLINLNKIMEAINIMSSIPQEAQSNILFIYLNYIAYKILVEESPSNYNESMLNFYEKKFNELKPDNNAVNEVKAYLNQTLNINKG